MRGFIPRLSLAFVFVLASCTTRPVTEVVVEIDAEPALRAEITNVHITLEGTNLPLPSPEERDVRPVRWPLRIVLAPANGDAMRRYRVAATATLASGTILVRASSGFAPNRSWVLPLLFERSCLNVSCMEVDAFCRRGRCESAAVVEPGVDAGASDAPSLVDADYQSDAGIDAFLAPPDASSDAPGCELQSYYPDGDGDNFGRADGVVSSCTPMSGYVLDNTDCNDADGTVFPGATEVCDGNDQNCDGRVDEVVGSSCPWQRCLRGAALDICDGMTEVAMGLGRACGLRRDGTVLCWGRNDDGALGPEFRVSTPRALPGLANVQHLYAGNDHFCALRTDGGVVCWGRNADGQLGDGSVAYRALPVAVVGLPLVPVVELALGWNFSCARHTDNSVSCWGSNSEGQLGRGSFGPSVTSPQVIAGLSASSIAVGQQHACAVVAGTVVCWGNDDFLQLGDGTVMRRSTPMLVPGLSGVLALAAGWFHTCAALSSGVSCWGSNQNGRLGRGSVDSGNYQPGLSGISGTANQVVAAPSATCALVGPTVFCWGANADGALGVGSAGSDVPSPTSVSVAMSQISLAGSGGCGVSAAGVAYCWGNNQNYQTGDGVVSDTARLSPVPVAPP